MKLAFYTYFYGTNNNGAFNIPPIPSNKYNCYYYTNNLSIFELLKNTRWIGIFIDFLSNDDLIENNMFGKHLKSCPHEYIELKEYDYLCFLDSKLDKVNETFVEKCINVYFIQQSYAFILREHPFIKNNVWDEYNESMFQERYRLESQKYEDYITQQINNGLTYITEHHGQTGFLIRNMKHDKMIELNNTWYDHIKECGIQCQISFFFVKQLFPKIIYFLQENPFVIKEQCEIAELKNEIAELKNSVKDLIEIIKATFVK